MIFLILLNSHSERRMTSLSMFQHVVRSVLVNIQQIKQTTIWINSDHPQTDKFTGKHFELLKSNVFVSGAFRITDFSN